MAISDGLPGADSGERARRPAGPALFGERKDFGFALRLLQQATAAAAGGQFGAAGVGPPAGHSSIQARRRSLPRRGGADPRPATCY
jgi:hypothetical protein